MIQNLLDGHGVFNAGDDAHRALALLTDFDIDVEHPVQSLGPAHRHMAFAEAAVIPVFIGLLAAFAPASRRDQSPVFAVMSMDGRYAENAGAFFCGARTPRGSG